MPLIFRLSAPLRCQANVHLSHALITVPTLHLHSHSEVDGLLAASSLPKMKTPKKSVCKCKVVSMIVDGRLVVLQWCT
jgi:hypothetical protein